MGDMNYYRSEQTNCEPSQKLRLSKQGFCLTLVVPPGKRKYMCRILKPIVKDVRGLSSFLDVTERPGINHKQGKQLRQTAPNYTVSSHELSTPALAVMLFLPEHSHTQTTPDAAMARQKFLEFPWRYHHAIQLQNVGAAPSVLGQQEFYFLSRQLPLWSVSAGLQLSGLKVRFNIFVRRFNAMVEFYRLVTGSEMDSRKPGFCVFPLNSAHLSDEFDSSTTSEDDSTSISCELALKHCPMVNPFPLSEAHLSFPVSNLKSLLRILPTQARRVSNRRYLIHDPDGNPLILLNTDHHKDIDIIPGIESHVSSNIEPNHTRLVIDKSSEHEFSIDSGRYSDFETSSFELENCMSRLVEEVDLLRTNRGRHSYDSGIFSHDLVKQETNRPDQTLLQSKVGQKCLHPMMFHETTHDKDKHTQHDKSSRDDLLDRNSLSNPTQCKCNSLNDRVSLNITAHCRSMIQCSAYDRSKPQTCADNVFLRDALLSNRSFFSETEL